MTTVHTAACVMSAAKAKGERDSIAMISMAYLFITNKGIYIDKEAGWDDPDALKVLVVNDNKSNAVFAHAVPQKGINGKRSASDNIVEDYYGSGMQNSGEVRN